MASVDIYSVPGVRQAARQEMLFQQEQEDRLRQIEMQRAQELRAQQAAQLAAQEEARRAAAHPLEMQRADLTNRAAQTEIDLGDVMRTADADIAGWVGYQLPTGERPYATGFSNLPPEAKNHFLYSYPRVPLQRIVQGVNTASRAVTGDPMTGVPQLKHSQYPIDTAVQTDKEGNTVVSQQTVTPNPRQHINPTSDIVDKFTDIDESLKMLNTMRQKYEAIKGRALTGPKMRLVPDVVADKMRALAGPEYEELVSTSKQIASRLARSLGGEKGPLSDEDLKRWGAIVGDANTSPEAFKQITDNLESQLRNRYTTMREQYGRMYPVDLLPEIPGLNEQPAPAAPTRPAAPVPARTPAPAAKTPTAAPQAQRVDISGYTQEQINALPPGKYIYNGKNVSKK